MAFGDKPRQCWNCYEWKHVSEFRTELDTYANLCGDCSKTIPFSYREQSRQNARVSANNARTIPAGQITLRHWLQILAESGGACIYCKKQVGTEKLVLEHLVPLARGGANDNSNITAACNSCNKTKRTKTAEEYICWSGN